MARGAFEQRRGGLLCVCLGGLILAALPGFAACGSGEGGDPQTGPIAVSLQVPPSARAGETVPLKLIARNVTGAPVEFGLGCSDFVVTARDGVEIWRLIDGEPPEVVVCDASWSFRTLGPGEQLTLSGEWEETDTRSVPVASGDYLVRGVLDIGLDVSTPDERGLTLETETKPLAIVGEQPPQPIGLTLEVPPSVGAGEPVPLRLIATNVSDAPVTLGLWGPPTFCRDFVVSTADGLEVWRRLDAVPCIYFSRITFERKTLNPGEQLILQAEWNQTGTRGNPVAAGSYVVRGFLPTTLDVDTPDERVLTFESEAKPLVIEPQ